MININKEHVAIEKAKISGTSKAKAMEELDQTLQAVISVLGNAKNEEPNKKGVRAKLLMVGFGSFDLVAVPERTHRNPQTQDKVTKKAHNKIKFIEGKYLADETN
jgi:nucleoid DNA-binding protein